MKAIISRIDLLTLIGKLQSAVPSKPAIPILSNLLIEASKGQLVISSTDLIISMRVCVSATVLTEGSITLPARRFFQLVRELTASQIEIDCPSPDTAFIQAGTSRFKILGMDASEFPAFPDLSDAVTFKMESHKLKRMLSCVCFAASREDNRQVFNGILLKILGAKALCIGTDGKRLAKIDSDIPLDASFAAEYILPIKAVEEIIHLVDGKDELVTISLMPGKVAIESESTLLVTLLVTGHYPDVSRIIPAKAEKPIVLHKDEMISLLRQVILFTPDASSSARFIFEEGELQILATTGEIGEGKVSMPVNYSGPSLTLALNPLYFLDALRHSQDETVSFTLSDPFNPGLITDQTTAQFVIMPMRITSEAQTPAYA